MTMSHVGHKGQVILPKEVRDALGISPGDRVVFDVQDGKLVVIPVPLRTPSDFLGVLRTHKPITIKDGRRDYQNHLVDKLKEGQPDA